jgi:outer membrane biosynthesis protein TonB
MKLHKRNGLLYSFLIHFAAFCIIYFGTPNFVKNAPKERVIAVEVMKVSDLTNIPNRAKSKKQSAQKDSPATQSEPKETKPIKTEEAPPPTPDKKPDPSKKENVPQDKKKVEPSKNKNNKDDKKVEKDKKKDSKKKTTAKKSDPFSDPSFMKTLEESAKKSRPSNELQDILEELESESDKPYNPDMELSISEKDLIVSTIQTQIHKSWYNNGLDTKDLKVILRITFDIKGNILVVEPEYKNNPSPLYPSFVENAIRATKMASPIKNLPADKFSSWENVELEFDPSDSIL